MHIALFVTDSPTPSHVRERDHRDGDRDGLGRTVRTRDWKYIRNLHPEFQHHTHISRSSGPSGLVYWNTWLAAAATSSH